MVSKTIKIVIGAIAIVAVIVAVALGIYFGTKGNLKLTIMDRCETYLKKNDLTSQDGCEKIWDSFTQAFVGKDPCEVPPDAYDSLIHRVSKVSKKPTCNRRMFWSKTEKTAHEYAKKCSYLTLEDTLPASLLDGVKDRWCGKEESQEIFTTGCPSWSDCVNNPVRSFWDRSSATFAASACGDVSVMLNGSIDNPFNPDSTFARVEVPNFTSKMKKLTVLLVTEDKGKCKSDKSLNNLQKDLDQQGEKLHHKFKYNCTVVPQSQLQTCIVY